MEHIRSNVPITEVAHGLGLKLAGRNAAHCWRTEHHQHGDRTASISFRKNRATCYVCDSRPLSNLDLVIAHQGFDLLDATRWICARWDVPTVAKGKKLVRSERWRSGRVGVSRFPFEELIRSGFWASLDDAARAILPALVCFADPSTGEAEISYRAMSRYSGKRSDTTISAVIARLERIGLLKVSRAKDGTFRACGRYQLDWGNEHFQEALNACHETLKVERDAERTLRAEGKALLRSKPFSTRVECQQNAHFSTVERGVKQEQQLKNAHFSTVERGVSEVFSLPVLNTLPAWETPTFAEIPWPQGRDDGTAFDFGWNVERASA